MKIKKLDFIQGNVDGCHEARTSLGTYCINAVNMLCIMNNDGASWTEHKTLEEAKEAAQHDFNKRILACVEEG